MKTECLQSTDHRAKSSEMRIIRLLGPNVESFVGYGLYFVWAWKHISQCTGRRAGSATVGSKPILVISSRTTWTI